MCAFLVFRDAPRSRRLIFGDISSLCNGIVPRGKEGGRQGQRRMVNNFAKCKAKRVFVALRDVGEEKKERRTR